MSKKSTKNSPPFDFRTIKSFEDACAKENIDPTALPDVSMVPEDLRKPIINSYKLYIIFKAINNGWKPDWNKSSQYKYFPWFGVAFSGFGFSFAHYDYDHTGTAVSAHLCTDTSEKALYIAKQFQSEYQEYLLHPE